MQYRNSATGEYPISFQQVMDMNQDKIIPAEKDWTDAVLASLGVDAVEVLSQPTFNPLTQDCIPTPNKKVNGKWQQGWQVVTSSLAAERIEARKQQLNDYVANARWRKENKGFTAEGMKVPTDDRSKLLLMAARISAKENPKYKVRWKVGRGSFVTLDANTLVALGQAMEDYISQCFVIEDDVVQKISSGEITTEAQIDAAFGV